MVKIGEQKNYPTSAKTEFLEKQGDEAPLKKISKKLNQLRFGSNFKGKPKPINDQSWWKNVKPSEPKSNFLLKSGGGVETPQNQPKSQPTQIWLKFSG